MIYSISPELYREVAERLTDAVGPGSYFSGTLTFGFGGMECRLTASVIVYRSRVVQPDGAAEAITDLVPVWFEFHTTGDGVETLNDFGFSELRRCL